MIEFSRADFKDLADKCSINKFFASIERRYQPIRYTVYYTDSRNRWGMFQTRVTTPVYDYGFIVKDLEARIEKGASNPKWLPVWERQLELLRSTR